MVLVYIGYLFALIGFVGAVIILIHAFKTSVGQGFLCLCVPIYILYYMFAKFQSAKKGLIIAMFFGGSIIGGALMGVGMGQVAAQAGAEFQKALKEMPIKAK